MTLEEYTNKIEGKAIIISCNDCYCMNQVVGNDNLTVHTLFGNMISLSRKADLKYFKYCVQEQNVNNIIIAGHYNCDILEFLKEKGTQGPLWDDAKKVLAKLESTIGNLESSLDEKRRLIWLNVVQQIVTLSTLDFFRDRMSNGDLQVTGIIIDDEQSNKVEEVEVMEFEHGIN